MFFFIPLEGTESGAFFDIISDNILKKFDIDLSHFLVILDRYR